MKFPAIDSPGGRRAWAFAALVGGAMVFTLFAAVGVWLVRNSAGLSFWLALAAHVQVFVVLLSIGALLVKRTVTVSRDGATYKDHDDPAQKVADAAQQEADEIKESGDAEVV